MSRLRQEGSALAVLGLILLGALALRLWNLDHGLPFAYNADEAEHFVPRALAIAGGGGLDPGYYENPPSLTYLLALVYWIGGTADAVLTARVVVALIGTLVVGLTFVAGRRAFDTRSGLVAAAVMAVAFLPVFYSKHALNDVVTLAPVAVALIGALLVYERGRWVDYALCGGAIGVATATKYTAGAMLLTLAVAAGLRVLADRAELRRVLAGCALAVAAFLALFLILNPYALLNLREVRRQISGQSGQAASGKLGQDDVLGWVYYVGTLGWGLGWLPLAAAVGGAIVAIRRDWRRAVLLLAFPVFLYLYMGSQGRYFGRWLLPAYPALCVLAGYGVASLATSLRRPALLTAVLAVVVCAQGLLASVHVGRVLGREDTRTLALDWLRANVPRGRADRRRAVRPGRVGGGVREVAGPAAVPGLREAVAGARHRPLPRGRVLHGRGRQHPEGARAEGGPGLGRALLPGARRRRRGDDHVLPLRRGRRPRRVLLRLLVQLRAARVRAPRAGRRDPPAVGLPVTGAAIMTRRACP